MSVELHVGSRKEKLSDPEFDPICALFYSILNDVPPGKGQREVTGCILVDTASANEMAARNQKEQDACSSSPSSLPDAGPSTTADRSKQLLIERTGLPSLNVMYVATEEGLLEEFLDLVRRLVDVFQFVHGFSDCFCCVIYSISETYIVLKFQMFILD